MTAQQYLDQLYSQEQLAFCASLPKIELHAHLNGSIRGATIRELASQQSIAPELVELTQKGHRTLSECFKLFDVIHKVTTNHASISRITHEVIEDFAADNVIYLELRTTPKDRNEHGMTKRTYVEAVLDGIRQYHEAASTSSDCNEILVKLLLSIDRREGPQAALETVELAAELQPRGVVGIDLSGNPALGSWTAWEPALRKARELGLKLTLHAAEVYNPEETAAMLGLRPERLGHMCCLDDSLESALRSARIPLELCLSSNVITESVASYPDHHFLPLFSAGHPVILCTDDSGVFLTSLSREYAIAASAFQLDQVALLHLAEAAVEHCFASLQEKEQLRSRFEGFRLKHAEIGTQRASVPLEPVLDAIYFDNT